MKDNALSVANYFIELAQKDDIELRPLKLMKLVYIAHGFMLAMMDRSALNPRFDKVEAWKYGPVIPSVYHSFKTYGNSPITSKTVTFGEEEVDMYGEICIVMVTPELKDKEARKVCEFVWDRYKDCTDSDLVTLLHKPNTPWGKMYEEGQNRLIPDMITKAYYKGLVKYLLEVNRYGEN